MLYPVHRVVFSGMLNGIIRAARKDWNMASIQVGDRAPDFTLPSQTGQQVSLAEFRGSKAVVLFFYPKDGTAVCTKEACSFRDAYEDFVQAGAVVIGVSSDSAESHQAFASGHRLPFVLLADADGSAAQGLWRAQDLGDHARPGHLRHRQRGDRPAHVQFAVRGRSARFRSSGRGSTIGAELNARRAARLRWSRT